MVGKVQTGLLVIPCLLLASCGGDATQATVKGTIRYQDGSPVPGGAVTFKPVIEPKAGDDKDAQADKRYGSGIAANGSYKVDLPTGSYLVAVKGPIPDDGDSRPLSVHWKFGKPETSGLKFDAKPGINDYDMEVVKGPFRKPRPAD